MDSSQSAASIPDKVVLLIEDEFYIRDLYVNVLKKSGVNVTFAENGQTGLEFAKNGPDLILLDIVLPDINGLEILKKLKAADLTKNIPVVLLTNLGQSEIIQEAYSLGAQGYLMKYRLKPSELFEAVKRYLADPKYLMEFASLQLE